MAFHIFLYIPDLIEGSYSADAHHSNSSQGKNNNYMNVFVFLFSPSKDPTATLDT